MKFSGKPSPLKQGIWGENNQHPRLFLVRIYRNSLQQSNYGKLKKKNEMSQVQQEEGATIFFSCPSFFYLLFIQFKYRF